MIGVPDAKWGERPMAFVVRKAGAEVKAEQIRDQLMAHADSRRISKYAVPEAERITFIEAIPKTSVGKINKKLLREDAA
ncbi:3-methylmercaptopropionyl-CoA ligase [compost metagenome]